MQDLWSKDGFNGVANGVTPVEQVLKSTLALISRDNGGLVSCRSEDPRLEDPLDALETALTWLRGLACHTHDLLGVDFQCRELLYTESGHHLDHLGHTVLELPQEKSLQKLRVNIDLGRLPNSSNQVLPQESTIAVFPPMKSPPWPRAWWELGRIGPRACR